MAKCWKLLKLCFNQGTKLNKTKYHVAYIGTLAGIKKQVALGVLTWKVLQDFLYTFCFWLHWY